jgi:arylsulfatase A-like enzyme
VADFYPTILEVVGQNPRPHQHLDGKSLVPVLTSSAGLDRDAIYWHYPHYNQHPQSFPSSVVREGNWKLIAALETGQLSLYNLAADIGETNDLSKSEPAKVKQLHDKLKAWRKEVGADPMKPNPQYTGGLP